MSAPTAAQLKMTGKRSSAAPATGGGSGSGSGSIVRKRTHDMHNDSIEHIVLVYTATWTAESVKEEFSKMDKESMEASIQLCKEMSEKLNGDEVAVSHKILTIFKELWHSCTDIMKKKNGIPPRLSHDAVVLMKMIMAITVKCNNTKEVKKARTKPPASPEASAPASPQASARGPVDKQQQQQQQQQQRPSDADGTKRKKLQAAGSPANNMPLPAAAKEKPANKLKIFAKPNKEHEENKENKPNKEHDKEHEEQANDPLPSGTSCFKDDKEASKVNKEASENEAGGDLNAGDLGFFGPEAEDNDLTEESE